MKKITTLIALFLIAALFLTSCNTSAPSVNPSNTLPPAESPNSSDSLRTFDDIFTGEGMPAVIRYFDENYDRFSEEEKNDFAQGIVSEIYERGAQYAVLQLIEPAGSVLPRSLDYVDDLYPGLYTLETNEFNINALSDEAKEAALRIKSDDLFTFCKYFYAEEAVQDFGFTVIMEPELHDILMSRLPGYDEEPGYYSEVVKTYTDVYTGESSVDSKETYPRVLIKSSSLIQDLSDMWKAEIFLPVNLVEGPETLHSEVDNSDDSSVDSGVAEGPDHAVIMDYSGAGIDLLDTESIDMGLAGETNTLAIFGTIYDVRIGKVQLYTESNFDEVKRYDELTNTNIEIVNSASTQEMADKAVEVTFYDEALNFYSVFFGPEDFLKSMNNQATISLQPAGPNQVDCSFSEQFIVDIVEGTTDDFKCFYLTRTIEENTQDDLRFYHLFLDVDAAWLEYDTGEQPSLIPLWVSSNMYDIVVAKMNWGEEQSTYTSIENMKAGTILLCRGIFNSDGGSYEIRFKLKDGTQKAISIFYDESGESAATDNFKVRIQ